MPLTTLENVNLFDNLTYMQPRVVEDEAQVGYYKTQLQNGVTAEISASMHAGIMKYQFPEDADGKYVLVDISHFLPGVGKKEQQYSNGYLERSEDGAWYSGYTVFREGWAWGELPKTQRRFGILNIKQAVTSESTSAVILTQFPQILSCSGAKIRIHFGQTQRTSNPTLQTIPF